MNPRWLLPLPLALIGFALGYSQFLLHLQHKVVRHLETSPAAERAVRNAVPTTLRDAEDEPRFNLAQRIALAAREPSSFHRMHDLLQLFRQCHASDLQAAAAAVLALPADERDAALHALFARWLELDPPGAAEFAARSRVRNVFSTLMDEWTAADVEAATRWMREQRPSPGYGEDYSVPLLVLERLRDDPRHAVDLLLGLNASGFEVRLQKAWSSWAKADPAAAVSRAMIVENTKRRAEGLRAVVQGWTESDPHGALAWFRQLADEDVRRQVASGLVTGIAAEDATAAIDLAHTLPEGRQREHGFAALANALFEKDRATAAALITELPLDVSNADLRDFYFSWMFNFPGEATRALLERAARSDEDRVAVESFWKSDKVHLGTIDVREKAIALAEVKDVAPDDFRREALETSVQSWASHEVEKARAWAEALPEGAVRERALAGVAAGWVWSSISEVTAWLDALPASAGRDAAVGAFARSVLPRDPAGAIAWLNTIAHETTRRKVLQNAWQAWAKHDRARAEQWREQSSDLTETQRAALK